MIFFKQAAQTFKKNKKVILLIKLILTGLILFFLLKKVPIEAYKQAYFSLTIKALLYLIFSVILQVVVLSYRWKYLIFLTTNKNLTLNDVSIGTLISFFVSQGLIASVGADAYKIWWMTKRKIPTQVGIKITLMDRIYGLISLMILCILSLVLFFLFKGTPNSQIRSLSLIVIILSLFLCLLFVPFKFKWFHNLDRVTSFFPSLIKKFILFSKQLRNSLKNQKPFSSFILISTGFFAHSIVILQAYLVGSTINPSLITLLVCLLAIPPSIFVSYMPFSIAGWGIREASMVMAFGLMGVSAATALIISITIGMAVFMVSMIGGILWIISLKTKQMS